MAHRRERTLGAGLAVGTAIKLVPAALVIYLVARRRWRAVAWFAIGLALLTLSAVPLVGARVRRVHAVGDRARASGVRDERAD